MLMRFDPFQELDRLTEGLSRGNSPRYMPMDAYRRGDQVVVAFDLPGVSPETIDLTVEKNVVTVRAERSWQPAEGDQVILHERPQGEFTRRLFVGEGLALDHIEARYEHGVLTLTVPVAEQAKPRKVSVTAAGPEAAAAIDANSQAA